MAQTCMGMSTIPQIAGTAIHVCGREAVAKGY